MNNKKFVLAASVIWGTSLLGIAATSREAAVERPFIYERGPNHRIVRHVTWQTNNVGQITARTNNYTELATGLHYQEDGVWKETKEEIEILPNGAGAVARQGGHKVIFAPNLNTEGAVDFLTPDGKRLRSHVLGLGYYDSASGASVLIAELQDTEGQVIGPNVVLYTNAFAGLTADVRYTYRKSGFEQDVILRAQPPAPMKYGFNPETTRLHVFTEFLAPPVPGRKAVPVAKTAMIDEQLDFGRIKMIRGQAFPLADLRRRQAVPTAKAWITVGGRTFLIEEVEYPTVQSELAALPRLASHALRQKKAINRMAGPAGLLAALPGPASARHAPATRSKMLLAGEPQPQHGYVLDYVILTASEADYTFAANTTYLISGQSYLSGTTTIQGGAVLKYGPDGAVEIDAVVCPADVSNPAYLTSMNDDSWGDVIEGSSNEPAASDVNVMFGLYNSSNPYTLKNLRFRYVGQAVATGGGISVTVWHCEFDHIGYSAVFADDLTLRNVLVADGCEDAAFIPYNSLDAQHVTVNRANHIWMETPGVVQLKNCLFTSSGGLGGYTTQLGTEHVYIELAPSTSPYTIQPSPWLAQYSLYWGYIGGHRLVADSPYRNVGTTDIDAALLADIRKMTTYWPTEAPAYATVDTLLPDVGYHYHAPVASAWATDTDGDGLVDAYEDVNQNGIYDAADVSNWQAADTDADGTDDLAEHLAASDPNTLNFTVHFDNLYVSNRTVTGSCWVSNGVPFEMAILVNSTNLTTAVWSNYSASFTLSLPDLDGNNDVLVAVRGGILTNAPAKDFTELTLDRVPPVLAITNPIVVSATATVIKPYLQLQGYADETLSTYSYDLTNEFGLVTNQTVCVVDQFFDTNKFDFTTNYFQAFDIPLATNGNTITVRVSDLAGNVTMTNLDVVLDYTLATNAPVLALVWPTNDMQISGDSFYIRGKINDETATLVAQQVDVNDVTNTVTGIVERNGMFWVENLPLTAGNNEWTIIATDAAGNVSSTNLSVVKSTVTVTITSTPTGDALYDPSGTVSGTVSDASYAVTVNGAAAVVDGSSANGDGTYNWTAENVSNYGQGTVTYDAAAAPPGGGGGSSSTGVSVEVEQPPMVLLTKYAVGLVETWDNSRRPDHSDVTTTTTYSANWAKEDGRWSLRYSGAGSRNVNSSSIGSSYWSRLTATWSDTDPVGWVTETDSGGGNTSGGFLFDLYGLKQLPFRSFDHEVVGWGQWFVYHYYAKDVKHEWVSRDAGIEDRKQVTVGAESAHTLFTGGKASVARKNLFVLSAGATEYDKPAAWWWTYTPNFPVPSSAITVGGSALGADGKVYAVLPDNTPVDVTVRVKGAKHYDAGVGAAKYKSYFEVFVRQPWPDLNDRPWEPDSPPPFGWPYTTGLDSGHSWWKLTCEAPVDVLRRFTSEEAANWCNRSAGYGPDGTEVFLNPFEKQGPGKVYPGDSSQTVQRIYRIGFQGPGLIDALEYTANLDVNPGVWNSSSHNCVHETRAAGKKAGVNLPDDDNPEYFGFRLPPSDN